MADNKQFGSPQQFGNKAPGNPSGEDGHCAQCEAMLADALDGTLSATDQAIFDTHMAHCGPCSQMLADAQRGAAWLEMLRDPRPEPPAELLEKILAQTVGSHPILHEVHNNSLLPMAPFVQPALAPGYGSGSIASGKILPFRTRFATSVRHIVLQPRLAMTAAMAFFSIALTLNLTGVRLQDIHASDLRPGNIQRVFYSANAHVVQYYEGLRVVYELESRVHELETTTDPDVPAGTQVATPNSPADSSASPDQPATEQPATEGPGGDQPAVGVPDGDQPSAAPSDSPKPSDQPAAPEPGHSQPVRKQPAPKPGISRREGLNQTRRLVAAAENDDSFRNTVDVLVERGQA